MKELKCKECGAELTEGVTECPACGCPFEEDKPEPKVVAKPKRKNKISIMSLISFFFGIVIIIMGIVVMNKDVSIDTYTAKDYDVDYAAFGGDFYTEIYGASDTIVDELNDINSGVAVLSESISAIANVIYYPIGMMIIAIGLSVIALSCSQIKKENL